MVLEILHLGVSNLQVDEQPSQLVLLPSSHCSYQLTIQSEQNNFSEYVNFLEHSYSLLEYSFFTVATIL